MCLSTNCLIFIIFFFLLLLLLLFLLSSLACGIISHFITRRLSAHSLSYSHTLSLALFLSNILSFVRFSRAYPCIILQFVSLLTLVSILFLFFFFYYIFCFVRLAKSKFGTSDRPCIDSFRFSFSFSGSRFFFFLFFNLVSIS